MTFHRNEIRTGLLVVFSIAVLVAVLIYLGMPGAVVPQKKFSIFFDNAGGLEPGAPVLLAGRKIGQVTELHSPVPENVRPDPKMETLVDVQVEKSAHVFKKVNARMTQPSMLGKPVIDFTTGQESSGLAPDGAVFIGERQPGIADAVPTIIEKLDPVLAKVTATLDSLQKTADNLSAITKEGSDLPKALAEFRTFGTHLNQVTGPDSPLRHTLANLEKLSGDEGKISKVLDSISAITAPEGNLSKTLEHAEKFTGDLAENKDLEKSLANIREVTDDLKGQIDRLMNELTATGENLKEGSDTLKHQPWRLIWKSTKEYPDDPPDIKERMENRPKPFTSAKPETKRTKTKDEPAARANTAEEPKSRFNLFRRSKRNSNQ
jgi:phospholipid/cholesterol/gamma-HCH transport system substrate-binding protein